MIVARTRSELSAALSVHAPGRLALVPTMGALHAGHEALLAAATNAAERVAVSIFVNPLQFGPSEDLDRYPRTLDADLATCAAHGVAVVFAPAVGEVYPLGQPQVTVDPGPLGAELEGASRPTHFRGVLTVVTALFGLVRPHVAVFGTKDYQQLVLVRRAAADLALGTEILPVETVRDPDGLALSSRNRFLDESGHKAALALSRALLRGAEAAPAGGPAVLAAATTELAGEQGAEVDYLELRDTELGPAPESGPARLLVAARVGFTRLIDNVGLTLGRRADPAVPVPQQALP